MYRTFNMGMGMVVAVSSNSADSIRDWMAKKLPGTKIVGEVTSQKGLVTHTDPNVVFSEY